MLSAIAAISGLGFAWLDVPAAWFLGPMLGVGLWVAWQPRQMALASWLYISAQALVGGAMSTAITPAALTVLLAGWFPILLIILLLNLASVGAGLFLARTTELDLVTAVLGTQPGGAPGMVALSEALGADSRLIALMQSLRILLVLGTLTLATLLVAPTAAPPPVLPLASAAVGWNWGAIGISTSIIGIGGWVGLRLHLPAGVLVGPAILGMLAGLAGLPHPAPPPLLLTLAYAVIGVQIGLQFDLPALHTARRILLPFTLSTLLLMGVAAGAGVVLAYRTDGDLFSGYLATTPGGLNVVTIIALESNANVALVLTLSLLRFISIVLLSPYLIRWLQHMLPPPAPVPPTLPE